MERAALVGLSDVTYQLLDKLGEGGFGSVWLARKNPLRRLVALKLLEHQVSEADEERLWNEALVLASLHHPGIVAAEDLVRLEGRLGLVTEYVEGEDLSACLVDGLPPSALLEVIAQVAWALHAAAQRGVVHRDVKPQNIRIGRHGNVKLLDFGIAFADGGGSDASLIVGTPRYMAPERFARASGPASDVFSLGCILWLGLTGAHFYGEARAFVEVASLARTDEGWDELLDGWPTTGLAALDDLARTMVARVDEDRPTASEVASRCEALIEQLADRVRLGEWCRERWPDGVSVPLPPVAERTASSLASGQGSSSGEADQEATEATERAPPFASRADFAPTEIAVRPAPLVTPTIPPGRGPTNADGQGSARPEERPAAAPPRSSLRAALVVLAVAAVFGFAVVAGGGVVGAALFTAGTAPAAWTATFPLSRAPGTATAPTQPTPGSPVPAVTTTAPQVIATAAPDGPTPTPTAMPEPTEPHVPSAGPKSSGPKGRAPGLRDPAAVRAMVGQRLDALVPALKSCGSGAKGRWLLTFTVLPVGATGDAHLTALDRPNGEVEACVAQRVAGWQFDAVGTAQPVSRTLRFP